MSCTWFFAEVVSPKKDSPFTEALDKPAPYMVGWYELFQDGFYKGWVRIDADGTIEFGEPGA